MFRFDVSLDIKKLLKIKCKVLGTIISALNKLITSSHKQPQLHSKENNDQYIIESIDGHIIIICLYFSISLKKPFPLPTSCDRHSFVILFVYKARENKKYRPLRCPFNLVNIVNYLFFYETGKSTQCIC